MMILRNEKGVALVVTLAVMAILVAAGLHVAGFSGKAAMAALAEKDRFQAEQLALSGIELAKLILVEDASKNAVDSVQEVWADKDALANMIAALGLENESLSLKIIDELSKIQINALIQKFPGNEANPDQMRIWEQLLNNEALNREQDLDPDEIIHSLKDWLDSEDDDAVTGLSGAESAYYEDLNPPYACADGPLDHVDEMFSIKGVPADLFKKNGPGDVFTIYGRSKDAAPDGGYRYPGRINLNTAGTTVLAALLPGGMEDLAQELADFREEKTTDGTAFINPLDPGWYKQVIDLPQPEQDRLDRIIRYSSHTFKIESQGRKNGSAVTFHAFLQRERQGISGKWQCRVLGMERQ